MNAVVAHIFAVLMQNATILKAATCAHVTEGILEMVLAAMTLMSVHMAAITAAFWQSVPTPLGHSNALARKASLEMASDVLTSLNVKLQLVLICAVAPASAQILQVVITVLAGKDIRATV